MKKIKDTLCNMKIGQSLVFGMAYNRKEYKNKIEEKLVGGIIEFYKTKLALLNGQTRWVDHWTSEWKRLLGVELESVLLHAISGFSKRIPAIEEAIISVKESDKTYKTYAHNTIEKDYKIKVKKKLPDNVFDDFFAIIDKTISKLKAEKYL